MARPCHDTGSTPGLVGSGRRSDRSGRPRRNHPAIRAELLALSRDLGRWAGPTLTRPAQPVRRAAQIVASAPGGSTSGDTPNEGALLDAVGSVVQIAQMHNTTRPAIAAEADVARNAQAQQIAYARRTLSPGYYRTDGGVVRVRRARAGHTYACTSTPHGTWKASAPRHLIAAAEGQRMTPTEVEPVAFRIGKVPLLLLRTWTSETLILAGGSTFPHDQLGVRKQFR